MKTQFFSIFAIFFVSHVSADSKWKLIEHPFVKSSEYDNIYELNRFGNSCQVYTRTDRLGLTMSATKQASGNTIKLVIKRNSYGIVKTDRTFISRKASDVEPYQDMFDDVCLPAVRYLPRSVKALFFGEYGYGSKPKSRLPKSTIVQN